MERKIIKIDEEKCDGCGVCIPACAEGALQIVDGKARLVKESYCDGLGACLNECPQGAITLEEREAEAFDEEEVRVNLEGKGGLTNSLACGCPSTISQSWETKRDKANIKAPSLLSHWPVKLTLVTPGAPYFRGDELVVAADCGPFAYGSFHQDFLEERAVVTGCPKFDDLDFYQEKLTEILRHSGIKKIIVARMEVPCCSGLLTVVRNAVSSSEKEISIEEKVIGIKGEIISQGGDKADDQ
ncbi:MAG: 4Fe-4S ferredoxin [Desulfobacteraceae bacterium]|nr:MAG: 4Fe-4S ferredoxin [Desulfobacteraceae bacterium]